MDDQITIRRAEARDLDDILRLTVQLYREEREQYGNDWNLEWVYAKGKEIIGNAMFAVDDFVAVAELDGNVFAFLRGSLYEDDRMLWKTGKGAELWDIFIEEGLRNRGTGQNLMKMFLEWCRQKETNYVLVNVAAKNSQGIKFYEKSDFENSQIIMEKKMR
jgi:GNAT superfamily N-acetyltransferase